MNRFHIITSYSLFADADTGIYPHLASPKAKRGIAMLRVD